MQKQIHVNSYVKRDGTQVKEHYRNIDIADSRGTPPLIYYPDYDPSEIPPVIEYPYPSKKRKGPLGDDLPDDVMYETPVLTGGVSVDVGFPSGDGGGAGDIFGSIADGVGGVLGIALNALPFILELVNGFGGPAGAVPVDFNLPQFKIPMNKLNNVQNRMKMNFNNSVKNLLKAQNQAEYSKLYKPLTQEYQNYQKANNFINTIKTHAYNGNFDAVKQELGNFTSDSQYKNIISDLLKPDTKLQNNISNAKDFINKNNLDDKFKYALKNNVSGVNHSVDFSNYIDANIKINNLLNKNRPNAQEMANIFLTKPQNIPLSKEYSYIPKGSADIINYKYDLYGTNKVIPGDWEGIVYNKYSSLSKNISNSIEMQNHIRELFNILKTNTLNDKIEVEFSHDSNLHLSIGHATILEPYIDSQGYFHGILFDKYDFDLIEYLKNLDYKTYKTYIANDYFWIIQLFKGHNYYILVPIIFKW